MTRLLEPATLQRLRRATAEKLLRARPEQTPDGGDPVPDTWTELTGDINRNGHQLTEHVVLGPAASSAWSRNLVHSPDVTLLDPAASSPSRSRSPALSAHTLDLSSGGNGSCVLVSTPEKPSSLGDEGSIKSRSEEAPLDAESQAAHEYTMPEDAAIWTGKPSTKLHIRCAEDVCSLGKRKGVRHKSRHSRRKRRRVQHSDLLGYIAFRQYLRHHRYALLFRTVGVAGAVGTLFICIVRNWDRLCGSTSFSQASSRILGSDASTFPVSTAVANEGLQLGVIRQNAKAMFAIGVVADAQDTMTYWQMCKEGFRGLWATNSGP